MSPFFTYKSGRRFDLTPVLFGVGGIVISWGLFRHRLFSIVPLARDRVFEVMNDGVIVMDAAGEIVDLNRAARNFLGNPTSEELKSGRVLNAWPELAELCVRSSPGRIELVVGTEEARRHYEVQTSPLTDRAGRLTSRVISMHDITGRKYAHAQWLQQQRTLAILEARERLEREIAESLHSKVQSKLLVAWHQLGRM